MNIGYIPTLPKSRREENKELAQIFGYQLKEFRYQLRMSRRTLAYKTGFSEAAIRHYEQGRRTPSFRFLCALRSAFGIPISSYPWTRWNALRGRRFASSKARAQPLRAICHPEVFVSYETPYSGRADVMVTVILTASSYGEGLNRVDIDTVKGGRQSLFPTRKVSPRSDGALTPRRWTVNRRPRSMCFPT